MAWTINLSALHREKIDKAMHGFFDWCGLRIDDVALDAATASFVPHDAMLTPWSTVNGAILNGLVELPSAAAVLTRLDPEEWPVTNDVFIQFLRPLPGGVKYRLDARLRRRSRTMAWTEVDIVADGKLVGLARITKTVLTLAL